MTLGMTLTCSREQEVTELLRSGHWPRSCEPELRAHVDGCRICRDTVTVRTALQQALAQTCDQICDQTRDQICDQTRSGARLDSPGLLWWRAQLRRRNAAMEQVARPIAGAQRFALALNLAAMVGLAVWLARQTDLWQSWFGAMGFGASQSSAFQSAAAQSGPWSLAAIVQGGHLLLLIPCAGIFALLGGVAVYLAASTPRQ